jgi:hypothetical protein
MSQDILDRTQAVVTISSESFSQSSGPDLPLAGPDLEISARPVGTLRCEDTMDSSPYSFASFVYVGVTTTSRSGAPEMNEANPSRNAASTRRAVVRAAEAIIGSESLPPDGSVAQSGDLLSVFWDQCQRWVHCYERIQPEVALDRHGRLMH